MLGRARDRGRTARDEGDGVTDTAPSDVETNAVETNAGETNATELPGMRSGDRAATANRPPARATTSLRRPARVERLRFERVQSAPPEGAGFGSIAQNMYGLMLRNIATDGFVFTALDPQNPGQVTYSRPGCVIASPSFQLNAGYVDQNYVFNWTRDAAITMLEVAAGPQPPDAPPNPTLEEYVAFARICQEHASDQFPLEYAKFRVDGTPREQWTSQSDGPALRTLAVLAALPHLGPGPTVTARAVIAADLDRLLQIYRDPTFNPWEEVRGHSFFARAAQVRCFRAVVAAGEDGGRAAALSAAADELEAALATHWGGTAYRSVLDPEVSRPAYDPNADVVAACVYGSVSCTDPKLLATLGRMLRAWADPASPLAYPINAEDRGRGFGPLLGRYPGDTYDGDMSDGVAEVGHPWPICTSNAAEVLYRLASALAGGSALPYDADSADFFAQLGIAQGTGSTDAQQLLRDAGDRMLRAVVFHSDHLELSEQFDRRTGFEKSVSDLTWSYAAFLSAVRARGA